ncbi:hypothetical protein SAMD00019534_099280 [Acytostelium subglobosum LB1]|uniref:hypothetical protein n=1 Tax=Acytostelium subglobosum LB1 TaxID=1410327 RepID=UPI0006451CF6|nr:hypothetical protein SAMD00019534_099280 [Acytostelium subglobosum LB1]GAM26753.1 hypothetical protein SAMD00019534_099280 [Acytostelium subglobosum LB1]|eukprot:XP_012750414.1 hypothetical protein SAMD00019534_099280 [Acytostelium subglobosum LB1]
MDRNRLNSIGFKQYRYNGNYTREQIADIAQKYSNAFYNKGANPNTRVEVVLRYPGNQFRSGRFTKVGERIDMFHPHDYDGAPIDEPDTFQSFSIFVQKANPKAGGCSSEWNNCLYHCVKQCYPDIVNTCNAPLRLKKYLNLDAKDPVPINMLSTVEDKFKVRIYVRGDHIYTSTKTFPREIRLKLTNGHYTLDKTDVYQTKGIAIKKQDRVMKPVAFKYASDDDHVIIYDGATQSTMSREQFIREKSRIKFESNYQFIYSEEGKTLEQTLQSFITDADALKQGTNGIIDMYYTGHNINKAAISHFLSYNKAVYPEHIQQDEGEWISKASCGPLMFAVEGGYTGPLYKYDVCKMYAAILKSSNFMIPIKRGEFKQLTDDDIKRAPPFALATELGLTYTLKQDGKHNALLYGPECRMYSVTLFGKYIDQVLGWIKDGVPRSKELYQRLWGALSKRNEVKKHVKPIREEESTPTYNVTLPDNFSIDKITPTANGNVMVKAVSNTDMFDTPRARIMPFIIL